MIQHKIKVTLPDVWWHFRIFLAGVLGFILVAVIKSLFPDAPAGLLLLIVVPSWFAIIIPLFGYFAIYPFSHVMGRYTGESRKAWLIWLSLDLCGVTFGLVRLWYYIAHIIPDFRKEKTLRLEAKNVLPQK